MARIAIIGLTGQSFFFDVPRFHAGGETIHATGFHEEWGGKGFNQAVAAARQGADVAFLTAVGAEDAAKVRDFLAQEGIAGAVVGKETRVTVFPGARLDVADVAPFAAAISSADSLLLTNEVPEAVNVRAAEIASAAGVKVILNPAPARVLPSAIAGRIFLFTPNEFEESALGEVGGEVVTTLGAKGCRIRSTGEIVPAPPVKAIDSTGAGDTFNGVLAVRLAEGASLRDACIAANETAAKSVAVRYVLPSIPHRISNQTENRKC